MTKVWFGGEELREKLPNRLMAAGTGVAKMAAMAAPRDPRWHYESGHGLPRLVGRTVAACAHPVIAWRRLTPTWRALMLAVYAATTYVVVLASLVARTIFL